MEQATSTVVDHSSPAQAPAAAAAAAAPAAPAASGAHAPSRVAGEPQADGTVLFKDPVGAFASVAQADGSLVFHF